MSIQNPITLKKLTYVLKSQHCFSFTVNPNQSLLYIQRLGNLFILQLFSRMGQIKKLGQLFGHAGYITCSVFMKKGNQFFTASFDKQIFLWAFDQKLGWQVTQQLQGHQKVVSCLILNNIEDQLISGSVDSTIRFWNKAENWECKQTIVVDKIYILTISLNLTETKLIACGSQSKVIVLELKKSEQIWSVTQEIQTQGGKNLRFVNEKTFILQPNQGNSIIIYKQDEQDIQFKQLELLQLSKNLRSFWLFPIKYIQKQNLLLIKTGMVVNLIKFTEQEEFKILYQVQYQTEGVVGTISEDGNYLITWDGNDLFENRYGSNLIQIRMLKQFN